MISERTNFMTHACKISIAARAFVLFSASAFIKFKPAMPKKTAKMTTLIMEVGCAPVSSAKGLLEVNAEINQALVSRATCPT